MHQIIDETIRNPEYRMMRAELHGFLYKKGLIKSCFFSIYGNTLYQEHN